MFVSCILPWVNKEIWHPYEYDKNVDNKTSTKIKFVNHLDRQLSKVVIVINLTLGYIDRNECLAR